MGLKLGGLGFSLLSCAGWATLSCGSESTPACDTDCDESPPTTVTGDGGIGDGSTEAGARVDAGSVPEAGLYADASPLADPRHRVGPPKNGGPATDEVMIVVNKNSPDSQEIGNYYAERWGVPKRNLVVVDWPLGHMGWSKGDNVEYYNSTTNVLTAAPQLSEVTDKLKTPIEQAFVDKGLTIGTILLAGELPYLLEDASRSYSVQGYLSTGGPTGASAWNHAYYDRLGTAYKNSVTKQRMVFHVFAYDVKLAKALVERGLAGDQSHPNGTVYFQPSDKWTDTISGDVQGFRFPTTRPYAAELVAMGVKSSRTSTSQDENFAPNAKDVIGVMTGYGIDYNTSKNYLYDQVGFLPGALADHLTSGGGRIDLWSHWWHFNENEWISLGATASFGSVDEPYAVQSRFAHPRMYLAYAQGSSIGETYYSGLQDLILACFVGDPLGAPFATRPTLTISLDDGATIDAAQAVTFTAATARASTGIGQVKVIVDGATIQTLDAPAWQAGDKIHLTIEGKTYDYTIPAGATQTSVVDAIALLVDADAGSPVTADDAATGEFPGAITLKSKVASVTAAYSVTTDGRVHATAVGTQTYAGDASTSSTGRIFIAPGDPTYSGSFSLDGAVLGEGWHTLRVVVSDSSIQGTTNWTERAFVVSSTRIPTLRSGDGTDLPSATASDGPLAVKVNESFASIEIRANGNVVASPSGPGPYAADLDLSLYGQGTVELQAIGTDSAGKKVYGPMQLVAAWKRTTAVQFGGRPGSGPRDTPWVAFSAPIYANGQNLLQIKLMNGAAEVPTYRTIDTDNRVVRLVPTAALPIAELSIVVPSGLLDAVGNTVTAASAKLTPIDDPTLIYLPKASSPWFTGNGGTDGLQKEWTAGDGTLTFSGVVTKPRVENMSDARVAPIYHQGPASAPEGFSRYFEVLPYNVWNVFDAKVHVKPTSLAKSGYDVDGELPGSGFKLAVGPNAIVLRCYNLSGDSTELNYQLVFKTAKGEITNQDPGYTPGAEYDLRIVSSGSKVDAYVNGKLFGSSTEVVQGGTLEIAARETGKCAFTNLSVRNAP